MIPFYLPIQRKNSQVLSLQPAGQECGYGCKGAQGAKGLCLQRASRLISY